MPYCCDLGHNSPGPAYERGKSMEPNQQVESDTELVTETLVEEVSIDGMCGVY
ncbi:mycofactocin precursor [Mycobacterium sp. 852013-50091_SCH5140682]|nr:mycofactocin precursor [Mycobacterium sp. 852013-50091_SCH5140682]